MKLYFGGKTGVRVWAVELAGKKLSTSAGPIYGQQKTTTRIYGTPAKAKVVHDELVAKQRAAGYLAMGELPAPQIPIARDAALEAELRRHREDPAPYLVYADWLQGQGSPLGEMLVFAQRKKPKQAAAIAQQIGLPDPAMATVEWRHGLWRSLKLDNQIEHMDDDFDAVKFSRALFASPLCAALEELSVGMLRWEYQDDPRVLAEAGKQAWAQDLARLRVGDVDRNIDMNHHSIGVIGKIVTKSFPKLTSLWIRSGQYSGASSFGFDGLELPELVELEIQTCAMSRKRMKAVLAAKLPKLERLTLWFGARDREATATIADVSPVWSGHFPNLTHLGLCNSELVTDIIQLLPKTKTAAKLRSLDLSRSTLGDDDATTLAASAKSFPALKTLDVSINYLTRAGERRLRSAFPGVKLVSDRQQPEYGEDYGQRRYVAISE